MEKRIYFVKWMINPNIPFIGGHCLALHTCASKEIQLAFAMSHPILNKLYPFVERGFFSDTVDNWEKFQLWKLEKILGEKTK